MMAVQVQYSCVQLKNGLCNCLIVIIIQNDEFRVLGIYLSMSVIQGGCDLATHVFQYLAIKGITVPL